ncbi:MAG: hypothetical protein AAGD23_00205 [Pseudomonadota bacterium]
MEDLLRAAYAANILILLPVVVSLFRVRSIEPLPAFGHCGSADAPVAFVLASLWGGILMCSALGLFAPVALIPLLIFQVVYKAIYLASFVALAVLRGKHDTVPIGMVAVFSVIVTVWPPLIWFSWV